MVCRVEAPAGTERPRHTSSAKANQGLPFYALAIVLSLINVELSLAFYICIDLTYVLPIPFLRFGRPDIFSMGAQEAPEDDLPRTHAKNKLPEVAREPE